MKEYSAKPGVAVVNDSIRTCNVQFDRRNGFSAGDHGGIFLHRFRSRYLLSRQLERVLALASTSGNWLLISLISLFSAYIAMKYARRGRFMRLLRVARISP